MNGTSNKIEDVREPKSAPALKTPSTGKTITGNRCFHSSLAAAIIIAAFTSVPSNNCCEEWLKTKGSKKQKEAQSNASAHCLYRVSHSAPKEFLNACMYIGKAPAFKYFSVGRIKYMCMPPFVNLSYWQNMNYLLR
jgi:hypothetical protein